MMTSGNLKQLQQEVSLLRAEGKYKETIDRGLELLEIGKAQQHPKSQLVALINIAACYYSIGEISQAFETIDAYQKQCHKHGDDEDFLQLYNVLFLLYEYYKDYNQAIVTLEKSMELAKALKRYNVASNAYSNMSHVFLEMGNYTEALEMAKEGLDMAKLHKPESPLLEYRVKLNLAKSLLLTGDMETSYRMIEEMSADPILETNLREKTQCYMLHGEWSAANGRLSEALQMFGKAKEVVGGYKDPYILKSVLEKLIELSEDSRQYETGFYLQKEYISLLNDLAEQELAKKALKLDVKHRLTETEKRANTDSLTGIFNRAYIEKKADEWLKSGIFVVCIVFDIDDFKQINDGYGHLFGDEVIRNAATACLSLIGDNELFGRYGGDEFIILMKEATLEEGKKKAEQIRRTLHRLLEGKAGTNLTLKISLGVSSNENSDAQTFKDLFHLADQALYKAKQQGKNQVFV